MKIGRFEAMSIKGYRQLADVPAVFDSVTNARLKEVAGSYFHSDAWNIVWSLPRDGDTGAKTSGQRRTKKAKAKQAKAKKKKAKQAKAKKRNTKKRNTKKRNTKKGNTKKGKQKRSREG